MTLSSAVATLAARLAVEFNSVRTALAGKASTTHAASHGTGGGDPVTAAAIGAASTGHSHGPATPAAHAASHAPDGSDALAVDQTAGVASLRTLGTGPLQAAPGTAPAAAVTAHEQDTGNPHPQYLAADDAPAAVLDLAVPGDGVNVEPEIVHGLDSNAVLAQFYDTVTGQRVGVPYRPVSASTIRAVFATAPASDRYRVIITAAPSGPAPTVTPDVNDVGYRFLGPLQVDAAPAYDNDVVNLAYFGVVLNNLIPAMQQIAEKDQPNGYAGLDENGQVPAARLPSYVDDIIEAANAAGFPGTGEAGKLYVARDTGKAFRWGGSVYVEISASPGSTDAVPEGATNLYFTTGRAAAAAPVQSVAGKAGAVSLVKGDVGLGNVANTAPADLPISTATQNALDAKQALDAQLTALAALAGGADQLPYFTGATAAAQTALSAYARTLLDDADAAAARTTLGAVGTAEARVTADQAAGVASIRTLGTGALQAAPGTHTHPAAGGYATGTMPDGSTTPVVTHGFGTLDVAAFVQEAGVWRPVVYEAISTTQVRFTFAVAPTAGQYRYLLLAGAPASAQNVPVPPVALADAATIATNAADGVHFTLAAMAADRILGAPTNPAAGQRILWEITASGAPRSLTLTTAGARSFVPTATAPDTVIAIPAGQSAVLGGMYSAARDRVLLLSQTVG